MIPRIVFFAACLCFHKTQGFVVLSTTTTTRSSLYQAAVVSEAMSAPVADGTNGFSSSLYTIDDQDTASSPPFSSSKLLPLSNEQKIALRQELQAQIALSIHKGLIELECLTHKWKRDWQREILTTQKVSSPWSARALAGCQQVDDLVVPFLVQTHAFRQALHRDVGRITRNGQDRQQHQEWLYQADEYSHGRKPTTRKTAKDVLLEKAHHLLLLGSKEEQAVSADSKFWEEDDDDGDEWKEM